MPRGGRGISAKYSPKYSLLLHSVARLDWRRFCPSKQSLSRELTFKFLRNHLGSRRDDLSIAAERPMWSTKCDFPYSTTSASSSARRQKRRYRSYIDNHNGPMGLSHDTCYWLRNASISPLNSDSLSQASLYVSLLYRIVLADNFVVYFVPKDSVYTHITILGPWLVVTAPSGNLNIQEIIFNDIYKCLCLHRIRSSEQVLLDSHVPLYNQASRIESRPHGILGLFSPHTTHIAIQGSHLSLSCTEMLAWINSNNE